MDGITPRPRLSARYDRDTGSSFVTDDFRRHSDEARTWAVLTDSNGVPGPLGAEVRETVFDGAASVWRQGGRLEDAFGEIRGRVTEWFSRTPLPETGCFVNVGLLELMGDTIRFMGSYAPIYVMSPSAATRYTDFPGPVVGPPNAAKFPALTGLMTLSPDECALVPSDGLLESRTKEGRINGDSHLKKRRVELTQAADIHRAVLDLYREMDAESRDSRALLTISWE
jgi:hypothetical protein